MNPFAPPTVFALERPLPEKDDGVMVAHLTNATYSGNRANIVCEPTAPARHFRALAVAADLGEVVRLFPSTWRIVACEACKKGKAIPIGEQRAPGETCCTDPELQTVKENVHWCATCGALIDRETIIRPDHDERDPARDRDGYA